MQNKLYRGVKRGLSCGGELSATTGGNLWHVLQHDGIPEIKVEVLWQKGMPIAGFTSVRTNESKEAKVL